MVVRLLVGDCRDRLRELDAGSAHTCVTSPPYFGLRDYGHDGQIGLEDTPDAFVAQMVEVFREVRRVLRDDGTLWLNLGDSYAGGGGGNYSKSAKQTAHGEHVANVRNRTDWLDAVALKPKDLIGIPWRVAFALQAPDYLGNIRREADRAWLAALVDGEGCISILEAKSPHGSGSSYPPVLQVRMCDIECIEHAAEITGYGSASPRQDPPSAPNQRGSYQWRLNGRKAADTIAEIYPFLLIKRKQAIVAWNHQAVRAGYETKRGVKIPADALEKQKLCRDLIQRLNRREAVDIPSWMIEPPQPYGPGWYLRQDLIWSKPNPMPESVRDRCTKAHEYLFLLSKGPRYYFDADAIREDAVKGAAGSTFTDGKTGGHQLGRAGVVDRADTDSRNRRSVWTVASQPFSGAHFATYPPELIEPCILAGCPEFTCAKCGTAVDSPNSNKTRTRTNGTVVQPVSEGLQPSSVSSVPQSLLQHGLQTCGPARSAPDRSLPMVWGTGDAGPEGAAEELLQQGVRVQAHGENEEHHDRPICDQQGVRGDIQAGPSADDEVGLYAGAPTGDGGQDRSRAAEDRGRPSSERTTNGQCAGELGTAEQDRARQTSEGAHGHDPLPPLRGDDTPVPTCPRCKADLDRLGAIVPGTVLDCFGGAGTTGLVADRLQRNAVLIELNPEYAEIARRRLQGDGGMFSEVEAA